MATIKPGDTNIRVSRKDAELLRRIARAQARTVKSAFGVIIGDYIGSHTI